MSYGAWCDLKSQGDILKLHDECPNSNFNCQKQTTFTPEQFKLKGNGFKNKVAKILEGTQFAWNKFIKLALNIASPYIVMAVSAKNTKKVRLQQKFRSQ